MKKITWYEALLAIFVFFGIVASILYILSEYYRGFLYHAFISSNILIALLFILLLFIPKDRIKYKINMIDKTITVITNISLLCSFVLTISLWGIVQKPQESQVSLLEMIKNYDRLYYIAFLFLSLGLLYSAFKPILLYRYNSYINELKIDNMNINNSVKSVINGFEFTATKTKEGIMGKLTGGASAGTPINYTETKKSASELIVDIDKNYPDIEFEVLKTFLDAAKLIE
ncbi:hypothetical protein GKR71_00480 [Providencia sp. wls1922]|uniref:hypothetical protein n=1 Tax=Providencia sp. wls1922 TaxID=2675152 RepID=UPI0012B53DCE|nr:hypothetical protein [Providencia sp. wls1922]MTC44316.1 hypothetical protein [Providencia sp. wls1922]